MRATPDLRVELVDGAVGLDARVRLGHAAHVAEVRLAAVAEARVDPRQVDGHGAAERSTGRYVLGGRHGRTSSGRSAPLSRRRSLAGCGAGRGGDCVGRRPPDRHERLRGARGALASRPRRSRRRDGPAGCCARDARRDHRPGRRRAQHRRLAASAPATGRSVRQRRRGAPARDDGSTPATASGGTATTAAPPRACRPSSARSPSPSCTASAASACPCASSAPTPRPPACEAVAIAPDRPRRARRPRRPAHVARRADAAGRRRAVGGGAHRRHRAAAHGARRRGPAACSPARAPTAGGSTCSTSAAGTTRALGRGGGLIVAVRAGQSAPTWAVTGTDAAGVEAAARAFGERTLRDRFAVAVDGGVAPAARGRGALSVRPRAVPADRLQGPRPGLARHRRVAPIGRASHGKATWSAMFPRLMIVGVPKETADGERRVAIVPGRRQASGREGRRGRHRVRRGRARADPRRRLRGGRRDDRRPVGRGRRGQGRAADRRGDRPRGRGRRPDRLPRAADLARDDAGAGRRAR